MRDIRRLLIFGCCMAAIACAPRSAFISKPADEKEQMKVVLKNLAFHDGVLEGEVVNESARTVRLAIVEVAFLDSSGKQAFAQDFRAVPGGDGQGLLPGYVKHFNYQLKISQAAGITVAGKIKAIEYD